MSNRIYGELGSIENWELCRTEIYDKLGLIAN